MHAWDAITLFCEFLSVHQVDNPQARRALRACDQYGNSVLMAACYFRPPERAIRSILDAAHSFRCTEDLVHHKALDDSTALQVACATGASVGVIEMLLTSCSTSGRLVSHADKQGSTPLSDLVVQYTLECKAPAHMRDNAKTIENIQNVDSESSPLFRTFFSKVNLLIHHSWKARDAETELPSVLHGASAIAFSSPVILTDMIIRCYKSRNSSVGDDSEYSLLHLAIASYTMEETQHCKLRIQHFHFVNELLKAYPEVTKQSMLGSQRSLLHHAISAGLPWQQQQQQQHQPSVVSTTQDQSVL
jgi:hypothetical protein